jgi:hypothetical protein
MPLASYRLLPEARVAEEEVENPTPLLLPCISLRTLPPLIPLQTYASLLVFCFPATLLLDLSFKCSSSRSQILAL